MTTPPSQPSHLAAGPFETERQAREAATVLAGGQYPHANITAANLAALTDAANVAGLHLGAYDRRILEWLSGYEPAMCAVIAGLITRAAERGQ